jgi:hypothetical protein
MNPKRAIDLLARRAASASDELFFDALIAE